jgi:hypothetical protein
MIPSGGPDLAQYAGKKHINRGRWNKEEDEKLKRLVEVHGERWDFIASHFPDRADVQCQHRWQKVVNPELVKGRWNWKYTFDFLSPVLRIRDAYLRIQIFPSRIQGEKNPDPHHRI